MAIGPLVSDTGSRASISGFATIGVSQGAARNLANTAVVLDKVAGVMADDQDRAAVRMAKRQGLIAGANGVPTMENDTTLSGAAFNDAALATYTNRMELNARVKLSELETQFKADPLQFQKAVDGYKQGILSEMSNVSPEIAPLFGASFDALAKGSMAKIIANKSDLVAEDQKAVALRLTDTLEKSMTDQAPALMSGDPAQATLAFNNIAMSRARLNTVLSQTRPDGLPVFKASEREKMLIDFENTAFDTAIRGYVDAAPSKYAALSQLSSGKGKIVLNSIDEKTGEATTKEFDVMGMLGNKQRESAMNYAVAQANAESHALLAQETAATRAHKQVQDDTFKSVIDLFGGGKLSPQYVEDNRKNLDPSDYKAAKIMALGGGSLVNDASSVQELEGTLHDGGNVRAVATSLLVDHKITTDTFQEYMKRASSTDHQDGPSSDFKQLTGMLDGLSKSALTFTSDTNKMAFPIIQGSFERWWQTFPKANDPKTGQPFNRPPSYDEGQAMIFHLMQTRLPTGISSFEKQFLGINVPQKSVSIPGVDKNGKPGQVPADFAVRDPKTNLIDVEKSAANLRAAYKVQPGMTIDQLPPGFKEEAEKLDAYDSATRSYFDILNRIGGNNVR